MSKRRRPARTAQRLAARQEGHRESLRTNKAINPSGFRMPGSQNPHKGSNGTKAKRKH